MAERLRRWPWNGQILGRRGLTGLLVPPQRLIRNGSEVQDPLVSYEATSPPCSPLQGKVRPQWGAAVDTPPVGRCHPAPPLLLPDKLVVALYNYEPKHDGDLGMRKGEKLRILEE